jgi:RND family efflux transporter MFP subunit
METHSMQTHSTKTSGNKKIKGIFLLILVIFGSGLLVHLMTKKSQSNALNQRAKSNSEVFVQTFHLTQNNKPENISLPGTVQGMNEAQIYSRVNGYVKKWYKDIGQSVKKGELLAKIDIPEVEKQVDEARANFNLAKKAYARWQKLREMDAVTQQEFDEKTSAYEQTHEVLKRLVDQLQFREIRAPFAGIVTKRNINVGDLVNSGNTGTNLSLFTVSENAELKVYIYVPQNRADLIQEGMPVELTLADQPGLKVSGSVSRIASAIDPLTRTMQVEIRLPKDSGLLSGYFVEVNFPIDQSKKIIVPTKTLLFTAKGVEIATVKNGLVERKTVTLGNDFGETVEVLTGIDASDELILNPPESIASGQAVTVMAAKPVNPPTK